MEMMADRCPFQRNLSHSKFGMINSYKTSETEPEKSICGRSSGRCRARRDGTPAPTCACARAGGLPHNGGGGVEQGEGKHTIVRQSKQKKAFMPTHSRA